jgi:Fe-S cluster assembly scaffold protein SufB
MIHLGKNTKSIISKGISLDSHKIVTVVLRISPNADNARNFRNVIPY